MDRDFDDPAVEQQWLDEQEHYVGEYLERESVDYAEEIQIQWCVAPYVSVWTTTINNKPQRIWIICGDLPTDYLTDANVSDARTAIRLFAQRWKDASQYLLKGLSHPTFTIGNTDDAATRIKLGDLLIKRVEVLQNWCDDETIWQ